MKAALGELRKTIGGLIRFSVWQSVGLRFL